ncbi:acylphosphatase [Noviherbaspirillum cavernae]|uniref:acylphosphatase n=1 Tax=Noviherbaspirillum cavernae TaxID=2320862 RepID=A0A418X4C7_9BURK|nr:acylphosphatase [Noviherbaspirillum cavernae]RJG07276.1 acylphosphatase [Noviherbaspirillum cavernae]
MAKHLHITGIVQGVGYRASLDLQARTLGLYGWVRNRRDGSVEAMIRGEVDAVQKFIEWARRGPPAARVSGVTVHEVEDALVADGQFEVLPTK